MREFERFHYNPKQPKNYVYVHTFDSDIEAIIRQRFTVESLPSNYHEEIYKITIPQGYSIARVQEYPQILFILDNEGEQVANVIEKESGLTTIKVI